MCNYTKCINNERINIGLNKMKNVGIGFPMIFAFFVFIQRHFREVSVVQKSQ